MCENVYVLQCNIMFHFFTGLSTKKDRERYPECISFLLTSFSRLVEKGRELLLVVESRKKNLVRTGQPFFSMIVAFDDVRKKWTDFFMQRRHSIFGVGIKSKEKKPNRFFLSRTTKNCFQRVGQKRSGVRYLLSLRNTFLSTFLNGLIIVSHLLLFA